MQNQYEKVRKTLMGGKENLNCKVNWFCCQ
jgi:hypothetical protein